MIDFRLIQVAGARTFQVARRPSGKELLECLRKYRGRLPADFKFDRLEAHERRRMRIAERHRLSIYDAMIVAAARLAGCKVTVTEDMQDGLRLEGMRIRHPF